MVALLASGRSGGVAFGAVTASILVVNMKLVFLLAILTWPALAQQAISYRSIPILPDDLAKIVAAKAKIKAAQDDLIALEESIKRKLSPDTAKPPKYANHRQAMAARECSFQQSSASIGGDVVLVTTTTTNLCEGKK